jgi:superfamily II DNA or RNA helicase
MQPGDWYYSTNHHEPCQVVAVQVVWGEQTCLVWMPMREAVVRLPASGLRSLDAAPINLDQISSACAAACIVDALERDTLVAPIEATVIPLPHQIYALSRAVTGDRVRYLLADEVGLGKTIEAGLILRELKIRGLVRRTLVVAPTGIVTQWVSEMRTHFNEDFRLVIPGDFSAWRQIAAVDEGENLWRLHDQVVCPLDSVKPVDGRRGWTYEQVARYNRERFEDLVSAGWDLIVVDEAHRLGGSTEQVARFRLGEALSQAAPYLLLLSATPHQGKTDAFRRLLGFLDREAFPDDTSISQENVAPYVIRTEKRKAIDATGNPLFKLRRTQLVSVEWASGHQDQQVLYESVTDYVRDGYNQAIREKKTAVGFLMILMQRLVTSSTRAIRTALERRIQVLKLPDGQLSLFPEDVGEQWAALDSQEQMESILSSRLRGLKNERAEVELLLSAARRCEAKGPDVKAQALLDWIHKLQREEGDAELKVLVFTEFVPTQQMLAEFLGERGFPVVCLNGSLNLDERRHVQDAFAQEARVLISTDAGGEGLNLQFCHVVFNYDLPWNPMKIEQRIGRVDRIGQAHVVRAQNFALQDTVELRVREVLEEKLARIFEEFGVDKLADVLDSEEGDVDFDDLYMAAVLSPADAEARAVELAERVRERARAAKEGSRLLGATTSLDPSAARRIADGQVPYWTERMTLGYLRSRSADGASAERDDVGYRLRWPDGTTLQRAVFARRDAEAGGTLLSIEHPEIHALMTRLPIFAPGQPLPGIAMEGISDKVTGTWSLWRVALRTAENRAQRILPLFVSDEDRVLAPTARAILDRLVASDHGTIPVVPVAVSDDAARAVYDHVRDLAETHGRALFEELTAAHHERLQREREKGRRAFAARRRAVERIGLPQVRRYRMAEIEKDEAEAATKLKALADVMPELTALMMVRIVRIEEAR